MNPENAKDEGMGELLEMLANEWELQWLLTIFTLSQDNFFSKIPLKYFAFTTKWQKMPGYYEAVF